MNSIFDREQLRKVKKSIKVRRMMQGLLGIAIITVIGFTGLIMSKPAATATPELICGQQEHIHNTDCYTTISNLICTLEETEGHLHEETCFGEEGNLICNLEETEGHVHDSGCTIEEQILTCTIPEHVHSAECFEQAGVLTSQTEDKMTVQVSYEAGVVHQGTYLSARLLNGDAEASVLSSVAGKVPVQQELTSARAYDIGLYKDNAKIEPDGTTVVTLSFLQPVEGESGTQWHFFHDSNGMLSEITDAQISGDGSSVTSVSFTTSSFSTFVLAGFTEEKTTEAPTMQMPTTVEEIEAEIETHTESNNIATDDVEVSTNDDTDEAQVVTEIAETESNAEEQTAEEEPHRTESAEDELESDTDTKSANEVESESETESEEENELETKQESLIVVDRTSEKIIDVPEIETESESEVDEEKNSSFAAEEILTAKESEITTTSEIETEVETDEADSFSEDGTENGQKDESEVDSLIQEVSSDADEIETENTDIEIEDGESDTVEIETAEAVTEEAENNEFETAELEREETETQEIPTEEIETEEVETEASETEDFEEIETEEQIAELETEAESISEKIESDENEAEESVYLTFNVVDQDGVSISGYEDLSLEISENPTILNDDAAPIAIDRYSYLEARIGETVLESIRFDPEQGIILVSDGQEITWDESTTICLVYKKIYTKRTYSFADNTVSVSAVLEDPQAIPDDARFVVTPVTPDSEDYQYDAYLEALNANSDKEQSYTEYNTLMYDIRFLRDVTLEDGTIQTIELQPEQGAVTINFQFKQAQLTEELAVENAENIEVIHLPIAEEVKEQNGGLTAGAQITADYIFVEPISSTYASVDGAEQVVFKTDSFTVFVFNDNKKQENTWAGSRDFTIQEILGNLGEVTDFAVYANTFINNGHLEGNIKVGELVLAHKDGPLNQVEKVIKRNTMMLGSKGRFQKYCVNCS